MLVRRRTISNQGTKWPTQAQRAGMGHGVWTSRHYWCGAVSPPGLVRLSLHASRRQQHLGQFWRPWGRLSAVFLSSSSSCSPMGRFPCFPITVAKGKAQQLL